MVSFFRRIFARMSAIFNRNSIRYMIFLSFTFSAMLAVVLTGLTFYTRFSQQLSSTTQEENQILVDQVNQSLNTFLKNTNKLTDSITYNVIKSADIDTQSSAINDELQLIYNTYSNTVETIALFSDTGELLASAPAGRPRGTDVTQETWFVKALSQTENIHYSVPGIQRLFTGSQYTWVVSISCSVEITRGKDTHQGVLLIDLKYDAIREMFTGVSLANDGYVYLTDGQGEIIYHPLQQLIASGIRNENNAVDAQYRDGVYTDEFNGESRTVMVKSVGYTGWKVIGVIPHGSFTFDSAQNILFLLIIFFFCFGVLILVNAFISTRLTTPIQKLEQSVLEVERGLTETKIYSGGSYEIQHLGRSVQKMVDQMRKLTDDVVREHELKRINELNALQAQINPHFLYNTLDIIVWMVENERPDEAVKLVTALARFFRISLSGGKNIITVADELEHVFNYLTIQESRYKNKFNYHITADDEAMEMATLKLVIQPLVENAIYHSMDYMDDDEGVIDISASLQDDDLYIRVSDNGLGMTPDTIEKLLTDYGPSATAGSGIGLKNVNERIKLYFGDDYGVLIESEPDVGTTITLHLPAIHFDEMEDKARGTS